MWSVEYLDDVSRSEVEELPRDLRSRFEKVVSLIRLNGLEKVHEPYVKHIEG